MGGTFDPIHMGHLILGEQSYEQFQLDKVLFMPSGNPPHKRDRAGRASDNQRVDMYIAHEKYGIDDQEILSAI